MSDTRLEYIRAALEKTEAIKRAIVEVLHDKAQNVQKTQFIFSQETRS